MAAKPHDRFGTVEAFTTPADFFAGMDPRFGTFSIPLLFKDAAHAEKVLLDPAMNKEPTMNPATIQPGLRSR